MKINLPVFTLFLGLATCLPTLVDGQIFVKQNAAGANDGTSWANAFTTLDAAISAASPTSQIWVAAGIYRPAAAVPSGASTFLIDQPIQLFGGFVGNETSLSQRDFGQNITHLSGDLAGNDLPLNFWTNRADNAWHVIVAENVAAPDVIEIDGFRISGARADSTTANSAGIQGRGGGIQALARLAVRNCVFAENWARSGAGIWVSNQNLGGPANGFEAINCQFLTNEANAQSAGIYFENLNGATIKNCDFVQNTTQRGVLYPFRSVGVLIDSCLFYENTTTGFGAALFNWQSDFYCKNTLFNGNKASNAGAIYNDGREDLGGYQLFENCGFYENEATAANGFGGAIENWQATAGFSNCVFEKNSASAAGAIYSDGRDEIGAEIYFGDCLFIENEATTGFGGAVYQFRCPATVANSAFGQNMAGNTAGALYFGNSPGFVKKTYFDGNSAGLTGGPGWGGAMAVYDPGSVVLVDSCSFKNNEAGTSGGAVSAGFRGSVEFSNSFFEGNVARFGGSLFAQNDSTGVHFSSSVFVGNNGTLAGGAINTTGGIALEVFGCEFTANTSGTGGAIQCSEDSLNLATAQLENSRFYLNSADVQAGAINIANVNLTAKNCLFTSNTAGTGAGGAISSNAGKGETTQTRLVNCTFANNLGPIGSAVGQWENVMLPGSDARLEITNCIFADATDSYAVEAGNPQVVSMGGNLSLDFSFGAALSATNDVKLVDPKFLDPGNDDFHLAPGSPCINMGVNSADVPLLDFDGLPRVGQPDKGCFESQIVGTGEALLAFSRFEMSPNPAADFTNLTFENSERGPFLLKILNAAGQVVFSKKLLKMTDLIQKRIDLSGLPAGILLVSIENEIGAAASQAVLKH